MKNRIVINLDQQPVLVRSGSAGRLRRRRWPKILAIIAAICLTIVVVAAAGVFFWWRHYQTTPAYSLALVVDAAHRDDMVAFTNRLDDEQLAKNLVASVRDKASSRYGFALNETLQGKIDGLVPTLLPQLKDRIHAEVIKEIKEFSARAEAKPFLFVALAIPSIATITTEGDNARALIPEKKIEVNMRRDGDRWKVVDFKDEVLVQRVVDGMMKDLPAIGGADLNIPLLKSPKGRRRNR
jgi:hypothetical protein